MSKAVKIGLAIGILILFVLGCGFTLAVYVGVDALMGRKLFDKACAAMNRQDYAGAVRTFDETLRHRLSPDYSACAYLDRGFSHDQLHQPKEALRDYSTAIKIKPDLAEAYAYRGAVHDSQNEKEDALRDYSEAIRLNANATVPLYSRGTIYMRRNELDKAIADFTEALRSSPDYAAAYVQRGVAYSLKKDWDSALASLDSAIRIAPTEAAYLQRAYVLRQRHEPEKATADLTEAAKLDPKRSETFRSRAFSLNQEHRPDEAISDFSEALRLNPKDELSLQERAKAYVHEGDSDRAISDLTALIELTQSRKRKPYEYRAREQARKGDYAKAIADFRQAQGIEGEVTTTAKGLAWLLATCPDVAFRNGKEAVAEATKDCKATRWNSSNCLDTLAAAYAEEKDFERAIDFEQLALQKPDCTAEYRIEMEKRLAIYKRHLPYRDVVRR